MSKDIIKAPKLVVVRSACRGAMVYDVAKGHTYSPDTNWVNNQPNVKMYIERLKQLFEKPNKEQP